MQDSQTYNLRAGTFSLFWLSLLFQNPLEQVSNVFKYYDEMLALVGLILAFTYFIGKNYYISREYSNVVVIIFAFGVVGLLSNIVYRYQPVRYVMIDLWANMKFFLTIFLGYYLADGIPIDCIKKSGHLVGKAGTMILFTFCLIDRFITPIGLSEVRHGIRSLRLFYEHPTYLAGATVYLMTLLTVFYQKENVKYMVMDLAMLMLTMRSKAIVAAGVYCLLIYYIGIRKRHLKISSIILGVSLIVIAAWKQIYYYYIRYEGQSARSILTMTSFRILKDYFPLGTGFATYASDSAYKNYSPVYVNYGFLHLGEVAPTSFFLNDTFWPIIMAQTGFIGILLYISVLLFLLKKCFEMESYSIKIYIGSLFIFCYLFISSTSEPAFNNSIAIPLAILFGVMLRWYDKYRNKMIFPEEKNTENEEQRN